MVCLFLTPIRLPSESAINYRRPRPYAGIAMDSNATRERLLRAGPVVSSPDDPEESVRTGRCALLRQCLDAGQKLRAVDGIGSLLVEPGHERRKIVAAGGRVRRQVVPAGRAEP